MTLFEKLRKTHDPLLDYAVTTERKYRADWEKFRTRLTIRLSVPLFAGLSFASFSQELGYSAAISTIVFQEAIIWAQKLLSWDKKIARKRKS